jgi:D-alanyl-D-alanine dipeptidase
MENQIGPCTGPAAQRAPDTSLDMGTGFDCFDEKSHTASAAITPEQKRWRNRLVAAMRARGLHNYFREWWHFSYGARPAQVYDFPIWPHGQ